MPLRAAQRADFCESGYVAWVGDLTQLALAEVLTTWFGRPAAQVQIKG